MTTKYILWKKITVLEKKIETLRRHNRHLLSSFAKVEEKDCNSHWHCPKCHKCVLCDNQRESQDAAEENSFK